jgi:hypothetical protein
MFHPCPSISIHFHPFPSEGTFRVPSCFSKGRRGKERKEGMHCGMHKSSVSSLYLSQLADLALQTHSTGQPELQGVAWNAPVQTCDVCHAMFCPSRFKPTETDAWHYELVWCHDVMMMSWCHLKTWCHFAILRLLYQLLGGLGHSLS